VRLHADLFGVLLRQRCDTGDDATFRINRVDVGDDLLKRRDIGVLADIFLCDLVELFGCDEFGRVEFDLAERFTACMRPTFPSEMMSAIGSP
jgi:hypothetical protein